MPKLAAPLTDIQSRNAKPRDKPYKLSDSGGLYLLVNTDGAKYWRMDYRYAGTRKTLAFGQAFCGAIVCGLPGRHLDFDNCWPVAS